MSPTTSTSDREVMTAWRHFLEVMHRHDVPTDVVEAMVVLDRALFNGRRANENGH